LPEAELLKDSQEGDSKQETTQGREAEQDIDTNQKTDINQNIPLTKEILGNQFGIVRLNSGKITLLVYFYHAVVSYKDNGKQTMYCSIKYNKISQVERIYGF
jgi:hypothetical protein